MIVRHQTSWIVIFAILFVPSAGMSQFGHNRSGGDKLRVGLPSTSQKKPIDPLMNSLANQRMNDLTKNLEAKYGCKSVTGDPKANAARLISVFAQARSEENRKYQAYCWQEAEKLILNLKQKNEDALANDLHLSLEANRDSVKTQLAVESCPGEDSEFRRRIVSALEKNRRFDDLFRSVPIKTPPDVTEKEALSRLRKAIYSESLAESIERTVSVSKRHGIPISPNLVDKICPINSSCANSKEPRDLKAFLSSHYERAKHAPVDKVSGRVALSHLSAGVEQLNKKGKSFNEANLHYGIVGGKGAKGYSAKTSSAQIRKGSTDYYQSADDILGSDMGSLLAHEPFKNQLKTMYTGVPFKLKGETRHLFFGKINETPSSIEHLEVWSPLPEKLKIVGGELDIKEAATNALNGTAKYANELNRIEESIKSGRDPDYGIFSTGDPETKGLAIVSKLNPTATARILLSNPALARSGLICRMIDAGTVLEKNKEVEGRVQTFLGLGSIVVGLGATLLPTGLTQVAGPIISGTGATFALAGTAISGKATYDSYIESQRTGAAYSATKDTNLKYDSEKAGSELLTNAAQIVGDAAAPAFIRGLNRNASPARKAMNTKILSEVATSTKAGKYALGEVASSEIQGAILARMKKPEDVAAINRAAQANPKGWETLLKRINGACSGGLKVSSVLRVPYQMSLIEMFSVLFVSVAIAETQYGCSLDELKGLADEVRRFAGLDRSAVFEGSRVTIRRGDGTSMSNGVVTGYDEDTGLAIVQVIDSNGNPKIKKAPWWELGHPYNISSSKKIPTESFRKYEPGQKIEILENGRVAEQASYVAETGDKILVKTHDSGGNVVWLE